jgi:RNA polymerase sigma-70 factor (ECF subfamily)
MVCCARTAGCTLVPEPTKTEVWCTWSVASESANHPTYRIAVNESLNLLRRNGREEALDDEVDLPGPKSDDPEQRAAAAQLSARIRSALMRMSTNDRMVLTLRHFSECSYQEIGQILDLDEKTVKSRLYEARQQLRGMLKDFPRD